MPLTAVIPLKAIRSSKTRMSGRLSPADRALLLQRTFQRVARAVAEAVSIDEALVVVGDAEGRVWAAAEGLASIDEPPGGQGLNAALAEADRVLGSTASLVLPADLPLVTGDDLDRVAAALGAGDGVVIAPTRDGGTGALLRRPGGAIPPTYGPDSAAVHQVLALRHGLFCRTLWVPGLALDLDQPGDIELAGGWSAVTTPRTLSG